MCWQCKHIQGESSKDHEYRLVPSSTNRKTESNNNPMVMVPVVGFVRQSNGSNSSLSFIGHVLPEGASSHWLPAIDQTKPEHNESLASILLPPIGKSSDESKIHRCLRCGDQRTTNPSAKGWMVRCLHWLLSTGIISGDSDLYDRNMEVDHDHSKVFKPAERSPKSKGYVRLPSPQSNSEDEGKKNKLQVRKASPQIRIPKREDSQKRA